MRYFNPRPPWGGRQVLPEGIGWELFISIHALRGEGDATHLVRKLQSLLFQSTPSVGRATAMPSIFLAMFVFQSTPSVGRATSDKVLAIAMTVYFNPRPPWGGRRHTASHKESYQPFQSTPSVGRATFAVEHNEVNQTFQSTPSVGRATVASISCKCQNIISIHALRGEGDLNRGDKHV